MQRVVILGTGGTIAGTGHDPSRAWVYQAAQLSVAQLVEAIPALQGVALEAVQVAQVDSKDVSWSVWRQLGQALAHHLAREEVAGVVITHGTDTLEETACMLHALHDGSKPVVLTAAMRPATAPDADGPLNLCAAVAVVQEAARCHQGGVVAVLQGRVWAGLQVRKAHSHALDAFDGGGAPPLSHLPAGPLTWPTLPNLLKGVVVVGTGHGTVHEGLAQALREAAQQGVTVWRSTRVTRGGVQVREGDEWPGVPDLTSAQARVMLTLSLMGAVHLV